MKTDPGITGGLIGEEAWWKKQWMDGGSGHATTHWSSRRTKCVASATRRSISS